MRLLDHSSNLPHPQVRWFQCVGLWNARRTFEYERLSSTVSQSNRFQILPEPDNISRHRIDKGDLWMSRTVYWLSWPTKFLEQNVYPFEFEVNPFLQSNDSFALRIHFRHHPSDLTEEHKQSFLLRR